MWGLGSIKPLYSLYKPVQDENLNEDNLFAINSDYPCREVKMV